MYREIDTQWWSQVMKGDVNFAERPDMAHLMNYMRIFSFMSVPLMGSLPSVGFPG